MDRSPEEWGEFAHYSIKTTTYLSESPRTCVEKPSVYVCNHLIYLRDLEHPKVLPYDSEQ